MAIAEVERPVIVVTTVAIRTIKQDKTAKKTPNMHHSEENLKAIFGFIKSSVGRSAGNCFNM